MKLITCHLDYLTNEQGIPQSHKRIFEVTNLKSKIDTMKPRDVAFHSNLLFDIPLPAWIRLS